MNTTTEKKNHKKDRDLERRVCAQMQQNHLLDGGQVKVEAGSGIVTLTGSVSDAVTRYAIGMTAQSVTGVRTVANHLAIHPHDGVAGVAGGAGKASPAPGDHPVAADVEQAVHQAIEKALDRRAHLEADRLCVEFDAGHVSLRGRVHSWQEREAVQRAAGHTPGVTSIEDHLEIQPYF